MEKIDTVVRDSLVHVDMKLFDLQGNDLDDSANEDMTILIGYDDTLPVIEKALLGKKVGEEIKLDIEPEEAFGEYEPERVYMVDSALLGDNAEEGMKYEGVPGRENDHEIYTLTELTDDVGILDGNHPLAGIGLHVEMKITEIELPTAEELNRILEEDAVSDFLEVAMPHSTETRH
jgi:FKBP-type peptidyl-prolyl cis-trans isomerase SlyD